MCQFVAGGGVTTRKKKTRWQRVKVSLSFAHRGSQVSKLRIALTPGVPIPRFGPESAQTWPLFWRENRRENAKAFGKHADAAGGLRISSQKKTSRGLFTPELGGGRSGVMARNWKFVFTKRDREKRDANKEAFRGKWGFRAYGCRVVLRNSMVWNVAAVVRNKVCKRLWFWNTQTGG